MFINCALTYNNFFLKNVSVSIVGKDLPFTVYDDEHVKPYLDSIESDARAPAIDDTPRGDGGEGGPGGNGGWTGEPQVEVAMETEGQ